MVRRRPTEEVDSTPSRRTVQEEYIEEEVPVQPKVSIEQTQEEEVEDFDFEADISIDPDSLDVEWLNQPKLLMKYSKLEADARAELEKAKEYVAFIKAQTDMSIRSNPAVYGIEKVTESAITSAITTDAGVREAVQRFNKVHHLLNLVANAVKAIEQRKSALENLVKLFGLEYFSSPSDTRTLGEKVKELNIKELSKESTVTYMRKMLKQKENN